MIFMQFRMDEEYLVFGALRIEKKEVGVQGLGPVVPFHRPTPICSCADDSTHTPLLCKCAHTAEVMGSDRQESKRQHLFPSIHLLVRTMARLET